MERYEDILVIDMAFSKAWSKMGKKSENIPLALDQTRGQFPGRVPADYVPPPQRAVGAEEDVLSQKRQDMLALVDKWFDTSLEYPMTPEGESSDLLTQAGWNKTTGKASKKVSDDNVTNGTHNKVATSCGDVLKAMLVLWKSHFVAQFGIRDVGLFDSRPGAKALGYYVEATGTNTPLPGDIVVLRDTVGPSFGVGHVGILVSIEGSGKDEVWTTADGGGGTLPDQTAARTPRRVRRDAKNVPILKSPTDNKEKQLDGWVDLDLVPRDA
jgi:hypothetical protein